MTALHRPSPHESAVGHVTGAARYVDDLPRPPGCLHVFIVRSPHARADIVTIDSAAARALPGVHAVLLAADVPGVRRIGPIVHDEPVLAEDRVHYVGHPVALVVAEDLETARRAGDAIEVAYAVLPPILGIDEAVVADSFSTEPHVIARGDVDAELGRAPVRIDGEVRTPGQDHFYLETQAALAVPLEDGCLHVLSSTQHPTEVQNEVARVLGIGAHRVVCEVPRMGGAFGGKESQATVFAVYAAWAAAHTRRPVRVWLDRDADMEITGKRHPFRGRYRAGFDEQGRLLALDAELVSDGGWSLDLSGPVLDRALFHVDNAYHVPAIRLLGRVARTNLPSNTAFRGFGGPQGMLVIEHALQSCAERLRLDATEIRRRNLYGEAPRDVTPYGQIVVDNRLPGIVDRLLERCDYPRRRALVDRFNASSPWLRRGLALQPVKFGISFTKSLLNQAGALVHVYADGTVQLNHGGTEMGQGLHTKMRAVCADALGIDPAAVRVMPTATDKVPNTSATAASSGSDLNGQAIRAACAVLQQRLRSVAAEVLGADEAEVEFASGRVSVRGQADRGISFPELTSTAWMRRVSLSCTGYYATPGIHYDPAVGRGEPFHYYAFGAALCEVELSVLTGEHRLRAVDIVHDVGNSLVPTIDRGQVEGGFVQGLGWLTAEDLRFDDRGRLLTHAPSTYKIPSAGDVPSHFEVELFEPPPTRAALHGSKAVGEPPLMLAIGVVSALRDAIASLGTAGRRVELDLPCTPEAVLVAVERRGYVPIPTPSRATSPA